MARGHKFAKLKFTNHQNLEIYLILVASKFPAVRIKFSQFMLIFNLFMLSGFYPDIISFNVKLTLLMLPELQYVYGESCKTSTRYYMYNKTFY